jgi:hypothetical protein
MRARLSLSLAIAVLLATHGSALAQDNSAAVESLFAEGRKLVADGKFSEACPKFLASYNLEHRGGTLLNLADCYEKSGQLASAWARFLEAKTLAERAKQADRAELAAQRAAALEPKLSKLTVSVPKPAPGLVVKRDGVDVDPAAYGVAVAVDAGTHTILASATNKKSWTGEVVVGEEADQKSIEVPELADETVLAPGVGASTEERPGLSTRTLLAFSIAGAGVVSVGIGSYFGVAAIGKNHDASAYCGQDGHPNDCSSQGVSLRSTAVSDATLSTVLIGAGAAAVVGGVVLWITDPARRAKASVGFDGRFVRLSGAF